MIWLAFGAVTINYLDRANLGIALPHITKDIGLSNSVSGLLLGAFFWAYAAFLPLSGWLVDRFGPRRMMVVALVGWSVMTMFMGAVTGFVFLLLLRLLLGATESPAYPASSKIVSRWFPARERALAASIFDCGGRAGTAIALPVCTAVIALVGWRGSFVAAGLVGLLYCFVWLRFYREPEAHPKLSDAESDYIRDGGAAAKERGEVMPWKSLFRYRTTWAMFLGFFCLSYVLYFFITWFPSYLVDERGFDLLNLGIFGMLPSLLAIPSQLLGGALQTRLVRAGKSISFARKLPLVSGLVLSSVIFFAGTVESAAAALAILAFSQCALTFAASSLWALPSDVAPAPGNVASLAGIQGFSSNLAGAVSPLVVGVMLDATGGSYVLPLAVAGGIALAGALIYGLLLGHVAPLGRPHEAPARPPAPADATGT